MLGFYLLHSEKTCLANDASLVVGLWCNLIQLTGKHYEKPSFNLQQH